MEPIYTIITNGPYTFTPLKNSPLCGLNSLTKLPVTDLNEAPQGGADSNLHWYRIKDNTSIYDGRIIGRTIKIVGNSSDCIDISITYKDNSPISACIPYISYDSECSIDTPLDRGRGSVIMIRTLCQYVYRQLPTIREILFEDKSNIECATEDEIRKSSKTRKKGTHVKPIPLYFFSIAFNGETWYEKYFRARQLDNQKHTRYKTKIHELLHSIELKTSISFLQFLEIIHPPSLIIDELQRYYMASSTFGTFFQSIPKNDRCRLVGDWISDFMLHFLKGVFHNTDWVIDLPISTEGGKSKSRKYYCPKGKIRYTRTFRNFGIDPTDTM